MFLLLSGCQKQAAGPKDQKQAAGPEGLLTRLEAGNLSDADLKVLTDDSPGMTSACIAKIRADGISAMPKRTEDCFEMTPRQRWTGLWRATFEGSEFCADEPGKPALKCDDGVAQTWFEPGIDYTPDGSLYRVEFDGRRTVHRGPFGHMGMSEHEMIADRMISMKRAEPAPRAMTEAEVMESLIAEEARGTFVPNPETKKKMREYLETKGKRAAD